MDRVLHIDIIVVVQELLRISTLPAFMKGMGEN